MMITVAWTGHRPKDLPPTFDYPRFAAILDGLGVGERKDIRFITGGALGIDTWAAEYALSRGIPLRLILPHTWLVHTSKWFAEDARTLRRHMDLSNEWDVVGIHGYDVHNYQLRNEAMVDNAEVIFAVWSGKPYGGTANCIRYALKVGKPVWNLLPANGKLHKVKEM